MKQKTIHFIVRDNNDFHSIEAGKTLLHLIEFDFTYFWEKCIEAGRFGKKNGRLPQKETAAAKALIADVHPYVAALIGDDFSEIVTDCIIEYICHSERIGLEELWVRCISPKNLYEDSIFRRISAYKTGRAINQWGNIVKVQEYARNKLMFIYDTDEPRQVLENEIIKVRREYFDLACSTAANELGIDSHKLPSVKMCSSALAPNSAFIMSRVARTVYYRFAEALKLGGDIEMPAQKDCTRIYDQLAMDAYSYVRGMKRPADGDMQFAIDNLRGVPDEVFIPDSLKAAVDLEFDILFNNEIIMRRCESCGRFFITGRAENIGAEEFFCDRVNSSGKTCRELNPPQREEPEQTDEAVYEPIMSGAPMSAADEIRAAVAMAVSQSGSTDKRTLPTVPIAVGTEIPEELEKRGQRVYNSLYKRAGKGIDENEFREWSQYLSNLKRNVKNGEAGLAELTDFLDYSDRLAEDVKQAVRTRAASRRSFEYAGTGDSAVAERAPVRTIRAGRADDSGLKPFRPEAFDNLFDAYVAEHSGDVKELAPQKREHKDVEIKAPQWKRMTREEAYGIGADKKRN